MRSWEKMMLTPLFYLYEQLQKESIWELVVWQESATLSRFLS